MIKIIDDFFEKKDFEKIQDFTLHKAFYSPRYLDNTVEKNKLNFYGNRYPLRNNPNLLKLFIKQSELKFNIKILDIHFDSGIDQRNLDHFKPHIDPKCKINILTMLVGPTAVTNGTVFYTDNELDIHVGFKPNRAVMFPSNRLHSPHASKEPNLIRFTSTLFVENYEE